MKNQKDWVDIYYEHTFTRSSRRYRTPYAANVLVGEMIIQIDNKKWILPNSIASWIATFDLGWQPEPISILLPERNVDEEVKWELLEKA
jgi:hypothetical protein